MMEILTNLARSAGAKPIRNLFRPLASHWRWPIGIPVSAGSICYVDPRSAIGRGLLVRGVFDEALADLLRKTLKEGDVFLDVGANVGYFSLLALSLVGERGQVHAFEVDPRATRCLRLTQSINRFANFVIHEVAVGEQPGLINLVTTSEMGHTFVEPTSGTKCPFPVLPLDVWADFFSQKALSLIKIDVEGAELGVLRGACNLIERCRPVVVCEAIEESLRRFGSTVSDLTTFMNTMGYSSSYLGGCFDPNLVFSPNPATPPVGL